MLRTMRAWSFARFRKIIPSVSIGILCLSCTHIGGTTPEKEQSEKTDGVDNKEAQASTPETRDNKGFFSIFSDSSTPPRDRLKEEQDLKMAKLWSRVDQLSSEQNRLRERLKVIEKGLTLGLIPEELKEEQNAHKKDGVAAQGVALKESSGEEPKQSPEVIEENPEKTAKVDSSSPDQSSRDGEKDYQSAMASAHDQFRAGSYGRAIVEYEDIGKRFGNKFGGGSHKFWVARCWINMKEYGTARQILAEFLKDYPGSTWAPRAKLELSRVEWKLGLRETSLSRLRDIIRDHPQEDAAEMAKMELSTLDKTL